jgi:hypothetical protein
MQKIKQSCHPDGWPTGRPMKTNEALKIIGGSIEQTVKDAWLVDRFTCQRMQDWRQATEGPGQRLL